MLKTFNTAVLILFASFCFSQNTTFQNQPFRYRYKMLKLDSAFILPAYNGAFTRFNNIDSLGAMWYNTLDNKIYMKATTLSLPLASELYVSSYAAPVTGSTNYIQNGTAPQAANMNISGNSTVGGLFSTAAFALGDTTFTTTGTATDNKTTYWVNNSALVTVNLPTAAGRRGRIFIIKKVSAAAFAVTIDPAGAETIDGNTTAGLPTQYDFIVIQTDGANWYQISPAL